MYLDKIPEIIGTRAYRVEGGGSVIVHLGKPFPFPQGEGIVGFFCCPFQILGIGEDMVMVSSGLDAIAAIESAYRMIGARLYCSMQPEKLCWDGESEKMELGFPKP